LLTTHENERMTGVGPGMPMGELLRRYWFPIAATAQLPSFATKPITLLGEELVLYRDRSGTLGLVGHRCPHRSAGMLFGVPEQHGLRCAYHGWRFDETGRCLEQPYETTEDPDSTFKDRVSIKAYPVQELGGMVFAYLGPEPAPLLPRWDLFVMEGVVRDIGTAVVPCNWLQIMENSLDPVHVEWLHTHFSNYVLERLGRPDLRRTGARNNKDQTIGWRHQKIGFDVFEYGIIKRRILEGMTEDDDGWAIGHPIVFPYTLRTGSTFQIRVPMDDERTLYFWYSCHLPKPGVLQFLEEQTPESIPVYEVPVPGWDRGGEPEWPFLDNNSGQDIAMWYTQGAISDRSQEHLGLSDKGVILYRKLLEENMAKVQRGEDPMNVFRDPAKNVFHELHTEEHLFGRNDPAQLGRAGQASKYSPILREAAARLQGEQALSEPVH
jgi:5,5'-dehydrodivanillate O-demethylase oxygenase subunit